MSLTRWLFIDVATASRLDLDAEAIRRVEVALEKSLSDHRVVPWGIAAGIVIIMAGWAIGLGVLALCERLGVGRGVAIAVISSMNPFLFATAWFAAAAPWMRRTVRRTLRECGHDICDRCGYLLDGLGENPRCPECGKKGQTPLGKTAG